jgi:hypothetical protein
MGILDLNDESKNGDLKVFLDQDAEKNLQEESFTGTFSGSIRDKLMELGKQENQPVDAKTLRLGRVEFFYGNDLCVMQNHNEGQYLRHYTNMIDLQKPWWRKTFLEHACNGTLDGVGLISPSVLEVISQTGTQGALSKFQIENILKELGVKDVNPNSISMGELIDYDMYSDRSDKKVQSLIETMVRFWKKIAAPNFNVEFSTGGGDMLNKIRLIPLTPEAQDSLMNGGKMIEEVTKKIINSYGDLIKRLKRVAEGKPDLEAV